MQAQIRPIYEFGPFHLNAGERLLLKAGEPVPLTPKAFDTLLVLVENSGRLIDKDELMRSVWPDTVVEENNLNRSIYVLRKALGEPSGVVKYIETVPKHGYRFVANVVEVESEGDHLILERHTSARIVTEDVEITDFSRLDSEDSSRNGFRASLTPTRTDLRSALRWRVMAVSGAVAVVILAVVLYLWSNGKLGKSSTPNSNVSGIKSIAVLPLKTLGDSPDDRPLSLGFADALITSLGRLNELRVVSINTVSSYNDLQKEPSEIGRELAVDSVFDGTLQKANGKFRVTLRLIRTSDGKQIWSGSFDENETDIFHLQDAMAMRAAQALALNLRPTDAKRPTENRDAYQAYLRGRFFFDKRTREAYERAVAEFQRAFAFDPNYALAYAGLADVFAMQANVIEGQKSDALYEESRTMAMKALELDESSADAHASLGWVMRISDWDWTGSEREFKRALELDSNCVNAHQWYALLLITLGRPDEALAEIEKARELEPFSQIVLRNYFQVRQYRNENALLPALAEQIISLDNSELLRLRVPLIAYSRTGNHAKVIEIGEAYRASHKEAPLPSFVAGAQAIAYTRTGQTTKAKTMLDYLEQRARKESAWAYRLATVYGDLGRKDEAIAQLEKCFAARDDRLVWLRMEPNFDSLRSDPRFQELVRRMHFPDVR